MELKLPCMVGSVSTELKLPCMVVLDGIETVVHH